MTVPGWLELGACLGLLLTATTSAQELTIGDAAPTLDVTHWLKGDAVTTFTPGQVYVLEFWATWCAPCVANMEHLSEIQERYAGRGVTVIGLSDEPLQTTVRFLLRPTGEGKRQDDRTRYSLATDPDRSVHRAYFEAAGLSGIPAVFVIGKDARIEWLGHPSSLAPVLAAVVDGSWDRDAQRARILAEQAASRALRKARKELSESIDSEQWERALEALDWLIAEGEEGYIPTRVGLLLSRMKQHERGMAYAREVLAQAWDTNAWLCFQLGWILSGAEQFPIDPAHRDLDFALKAARRAVELEPLDYHLTMLASIHAQRHEYAEAVAAQARAVSLAEGLRPRIRPDEMESYEADLARLRAELAEYERLQR